VTGALLLARLSASPKASPAPLRSLPILSMRVVHAHFAFKFLLPSFNARDVIAPISHLLPIRLTSSDLEVDVTFRAKFFLAFPLSAFHFAPSSLLFPPTRTLKSLIPLRGSRFAAGRHVGGAGSKCTLMLVPRRLVPPEPNPSASTGARAAALIRHASTPRTIRPLRASPLPHDCMLANPLHRVPLAACASSHLLSTDDKVVLRTDFRSRSPNLCCRCP
jgi:hypothetical protein